MVIHVTIASVGISSDLTLKLTIPNRTPGFNMCTLRSEHGNYAWFQFIWFLCGGVLLVVTKERLKVVTENLNRILSWQLPYRNSLFFVGQLRIATPAPDEPKLTNGTERYAPNFQSRVCAHRHRWKASVSFNVPGIQYNMEQMLSFLPPLELT